jgi:hypothetical protein
MRPLTTWLFTGSLLAVLLGSALTGAIKPLHVVAGVGEEFSLDIVVENVAGLYAWQVALEYNSEILEVVEVEHGRFLRSGGSTMPLQRLEGGKVLIGEGLLGDAREVSGSGVLARITFVARGEGTSGLNFVDTLLLNKRHESLSHQTVGGSFQTPAASSPAPTPQVEQVKSKEPKKAVSELEPVVQDTNSVAFPIEVIREEAQTDQHEQQAQPAPTQETQPTQDSQAASEESQEVEREEVEIITGVPTIYLTTSTGG